MPENAPISFVFAGLASNYCFTGFDKLGNDLAAGLSGYVPGQYNFFNFGADEPSTEDRNKPWIRLNADGTLDGVYVYAMGKWLRPHEKEAGSSERIIWVGSEASLWAYDGGDGNNPGTTAPTATTGAMWQRDTAFDFRIPLGIGTSPAVTQPSGASTGGTVVAVTNTGGAEDTEIILAANQIPEHRHAIGVEGDGDTADSENGRLRVGAGTEVDWQGETATTKVGYTRNTGGDSEGETQPISKTNMPPYYGVCFAKRTARIYRTI